MRLIIQPEDGILPIVKGIDSAKKSIEIAIFRFDHTDIKRALERAVSRSVSVRALVANSNRGEEEELRKLEMNLLPAGIEVARTASDLVRYHYKFVIIDRTTLFLLAFNFTHLDIEKSRSFGIITDNTEVVNAAIKLFEADVKRQVYVPELNSLVVSPINARQVLSGFIEKAERELLIYDPEISDRQMIRLLRDRIRSRVKVRIIGRVVKPPRTLTAPGDMRMRFHTRTIIRDQHHAFLGSQSLREVELDKRRELGLIIHNRDVVHALVRVFEGDWATAETSRQNDESGMMPGNGGVKHMAKAIVRKLPIEPLVENALRHALRGVAHLPITKNTFELNMEDALRQSIEDGVSGFVRKAIETAARA